MNNKRKMKKKLKNDSRSKKKIKNKYTPKHPTDYIPQLYLSQLVKK
jgi:hypothetical protein